MEDKKIRLIVTIHPKGGILLHSSTDLKGNDRQLGAATFSQSDLSGELHLLGLEEEAKRMKAQSWPKEIPVEIAFNITETEEIMKRLGFRETGERGQP